MSREITVTFRLDDECQQRLEEFMELEKPFGDGIQADGFAALLENELSRMFLKDALSHSMSGDASGYFQLLGFILVCLLGVMKREEERLSMRFPLSGIVAWSLLDDVLAGPDALSIR